MVLAECGKYYWDVEEDPVNGYVVYFRPAAADGALERRGGFKTRYKALTAIAMLAVEHGFTEWKTVS